jgi:hypothetical protein
MEQGTQMDKVSALPILCFLHVGVPQNPNNFELKFEFRELLRRCLFLKPWEGIVG